MCELFHFCRHYFFDSELYNTFDRLSDLLYLPMPHLPTVAEQTSTIGVNDGSNSRGIDGDEITAVGKWEDEEERRFYEDIPDLKDFVPRSILGAENGASTNEVSSPSRDKTEEEEAKKRDEATDIQRLESEMEHLKIDSSTADQDDEYVEKVLMFRARNNHLSCQASHPYSFTPAWPVTHR